MPPRVGLVRVARVEGNVVQQLLQRFTIGATPRLESLDAAPQEVDIGAASFRIRGRGCLVLQHPDSA